MLNFTGVNVEMAEEISLRDCEAYVARYNIQGLLKDCIVQLCVQKPDNPIRFLREYFQRLEKEQSARRDVPDMSPEDTEDMSPLPRGKPSRRGGISAEPVTEEDATSYVKKVEWNFKISQRKAIW